MKRFTILVVTALAAAFFLSPEAEAQACLCFARPH
jgi:hypothetical protein